MADLVLLFTAGNLIFFGMYMLIGLPYLSSSYGKKSADDTFENYFFWWLTAHVACAAICLGILMIYSA